MSWRSLLLHIIIRCGAVAARLLSYTTTTTSTYTKPSTTSLNKDCSCRDGAADWPLISSTVGHTTITVEFVLLLKQIPCPQSTVCGIFYFETSSVCQTGQWVLKLLEKYRKQGKGISPLSWVSQTLELRLSHLFSRFKSQKFLAMNYRVYLTRKMPKDQLLPTCNLGWHQILKFGPLHFTQRFPLY